MAVLKHYNKKTQQWEAINTPDVKAPIYITETMLASSWVDNTYSFEDIYPHDEYNIEVGVAKTATIEQFDAFCEARIGEDVDSNIATAIGEVPTVDIPIIIKVEAVRK